MSKFHRVLLDRSSKEMAISGSETIRTDLGGFAIVGSGSDGKAHFLKINSSGSLQVETQPIDLSGTISGSFEVTNLPAVQTVDGTVSFPVAPTATRSSVTASLASVEILPANPNRKGLSLYFSADDLFDNPICFIGYGSAPVSSTDFSFILFINDSYTLEQPFVTAPVQAVFNLNTALLQLYITEIE